MPRERIAMTAAEAAAFLAGKRLAVVGTLDSGGAPDAEPARLAIAGAEIGSVVLRGGVTYRKVGRDPRVVVSVEEFPSYHAIRGVTVLGTAVLASEEGDEARFRVVAPRLESFDFAKMGRWSGPRLRPDLYDDLLASSWPPQPTVPAAAFLSG